MSRSLFGRLSARFDPAFPDVVTRRQVLAGMLAAGAGLVLGSGRALARQPKSRSAKGRVVVIGAGLAGLAAADVLKRAGVDVVVLEARKRIGGRVLSFTDFQEGKTVEGGGEFIGLNHPNWLALAGRFGLPLRDEAGDEPDSPVVIDGRRLSETEAKGLYEEMARVYEGLVAPARAVDAERPWESPEAGRLDAMSVAQWVREQQPSARAARAIALDLGANNGVEIEKQSLLALLAMIKGHGVEKFWTETEVYRCVRGNQRLAERLGAGLGADVHHDAGCTRIARARDAVRVFAGEMERECDEVVLAAPPSAWARVRFEGVMPEALTHRPPQMGANVKLLSALRSRPWDSAGVGPTALCDGAFELTWHTTAGQPGDCGVLTAFAGGERARRLSAMTGEQAAAACGPELERLYPGYAAAVEKTRFMNWPGDEWTKCSYSFPAPTEITAIGPALEAGSPGLTFAGEHCSYGFVGYMEGALESGVRAAKKVLKRLNVDVAV